MEEGSAGSSFETEKRIFDGRIDKEGLLMRSKAWFWVLGENIAKAEVNCTRLLLGMTGVGVVVRRLAMGVLIDGS